MGRFSSYIQKLREVVNARFVDRVRRKNGRLGRCSKYMQKLMPLI